jgi:tetratricopeptide (TPR) repeat protein
MYRLYITILAAICLSMVATQSPPPTLSDTRLPGTTLVREDIFAGLLANDMERFSRGERSIQLLLENRPSEKPSLLAWKGTASLYRAVHAYEEKRIDEFQRNYRQSLDLFSEAYQLAPESLGVNAIIGGSYVVLADRLPKEYRPPAWSQAYDSYQRLWKMQGPMVEKLPVHMRGELLAGMTQSAQRTGRAEETSQYLDKMLTLLRETPYEAVARKWKERPEAAASGGLTCLTCHEPGRLAARIAALDKK